MQLKLIKENFVEMPVSVDQIKFNFFYNMIKKDLELSCWCNGAIKVFGEFQIYSDYKAELSSFDQIINFITENNQVFIDDSTESQISNMCSEHFLNLIVMNDLKLTPNETSNLTERYTNFIIEATSCLRSYSTLTKETVKAIAKKHSIY